MTVEVRSRGGGWVVMEHGTTVSNHRLKRRAVEKARRLARRKGTRLRVQRSDGTVQTNRRY